MPSNKERHAVSGCRHRRQQVRDSADIRLLDHGKTERCGGGPEKTSPFCSVRRKDHRIEPTLRGATVPSLIRSRLSSSNSSRTCPLPEVELTKKMGSLI